MGRLMNNIAPLNQAIGLKYITDEFGNTGISHSEWNSDIMKIDGNVCMINKDTGEIVETMESNIFNSIIYFWLMLDAPELFDNLGEH